MSNSVTTERSRRGRISTEKPAIAFSGLQYGQIIDADLEGLCFQYFTSTKETAARKVQEGEGKGTVDIVFGAFDFTLVDLPVEATADFQVSALDTGVSKQIVRRRALTFGKLTSEQLFSLKRFLQLSRYGAKSM